MLHVQRQEHRRHWWFQIVASANDVKPQIIKSYIKEAISLVDHGQEIKADRSAPIEVPDELQKAMRRYKGATAAFRKRRPGLQREYADYVTSGNGNGDIPDLAH